MIELPLFPLQTVLCPGIALPLHVFEPRYRRLTEHCLERRESFGIVLIREGSEVGAGDLAIAGVGTFAEIRDARRQPDGRYELLVVGTGRFTIRDVDAASRPYLVAHATPLGEATGDETRASRLSDRALRRLIRYLRLVQPGEGETSPPIDVRVEVETGTGEEPKPGAGEESQPGASEESQPGRGDVGPGGGVSDEAGAVAGPSRQLRIPDDPTALSYLLSGIVQVDPLTRQLLLEAATTEERLEEVDRLLAREVRLLEERLRYYVADPRLDAVRLN
jgi:Lon protease-like protein